MKMYKQFTTIALLLLMIVSASSASTLVPKNTVIPVTLETPLNSATNNVGDTFYAYHQGINGAGFPEYSKFEGKIVSVTKASGSTAGLIDVKFVSVKFPDGTSMLINGNLTSLDQKSVKTDPANGRLVGTVEASKNAGKFIAIGAGAGLLLGEVIAKKPLIGTILGAAAGYLYGQKQAKPAVGKDVKVAKGTQFGILLTQDVTLPDSVSDTIAIANPESGTGWKITFNNQKPVMSGNDLLIPIRYAMEVMVIPFDYEASTKTIRLGPTNSGREATTVAGSKVVYIDDNPTNFDTASKFINGSLYVPASYIELLTQRTAYWNQKTQVLRIE